MRRVIRLIGYTLAFVVVMPQIIVAVNTGNMALTYLLFVGFILVVEAIVGVFDMLARKQTLNDLQLTMHTKSTHDLMKY